MLKLLTAALPVAGLAGAMTLSRPPRWRWWHAVGFGLVANAGFGLAVSSKSRQEERQFYEQLVQAPFAPPAWAFSPVWAINNVSILWGDLALVNEPEDTPGHTTLLALQGLWWTFYATFGYVYFKKESPILALIWTACDYAATLSTAGIALRTGRDRLAAAQVTSLLWLTLATAVAAYQAKNNPDPVFGYEPGN